MSVIYIDSYRFGAAYDPDAAAYIARVEGTSGDNQALEAAVKDAINAFVVGCKADGIWNAIKASAILAGARTLNGALQPLVGTAPTNNNFVAGDYNRKTGLVGDGSTKYLDSNRNNNADPQDSNHNAIYVSSAQSPARNKVYIGAGVQTNENGVTNLGVLSSGDMFFRNRSSSQSSISAANQSTGLVGTSRSSPSSYTARRVSVNTNFAVTSQAPYSGNVCVFATTNGIIPTNARLAFYSIGEALDLALLDARVTDLINKFAEVIP